MMSLHNQAFVKFAIAEHPQAIVLTVHQTFVAQCLQVHRIAILEGPVEVTNIDNGVFTPPGGMAEPPLGNAADHGHLATFGKRMGFVSAGTAALPFMAARTRLPVAGTYAPTDAFFAFPPMYSHVNLR